MLRLWFMLSLYQIVSYYNNDIELSIILLSWSFYNIVTLIAIKGIEKIILFLKLDKKRIEEIQTLSMIVLAILTMSLITTYLKRIII